jgi:hypothetical protein
MMMATLFFRLEVLDLAALAMDAPQANALKNEAPDYRTARVGGKRAGEVIRALN